jgi:hypothetical protein
VISHNWSPLNINFSRSLGAKIKLFSPYKLKEKFPWINTDGVELASFGQENEGWYSNKFDIIPCILHNTVNIYIL